MRFFATLTFLLSIVLSQGTSAQLTITSMPLSVCGQASFVVQLGGSFTGSPGNQFRVELSDSTGSFANTRLIGVLNSTNPGAVTCSIVNVQASGVNYRIRVSTTNPASTSQPGLNSLVYHAPDLPPLNPAGQTPLCGNAQIIMFTGNRPFIQWLRNGNPIPGANSPVFQANQIGNYTVRSGPSSTCNFISQPTNVIQGVLPSANQIIGPTKVCPDGSINLQTQDQIVEWQRNGVTIASAIPSLSVTSPGQYRAVVQNQTGCTSLSNPHIVDADTAPLNQIKVIQGQLCANQQAVFSGGVGQAYQWFIKSTNVQGQILSSQQQFSFTAPNPGIYPPFGDSLCLNLIGTNSCVSVSCFKDTVGVAPPKPGIIKNGATLISTNLLGNAWFEVQSGFIPGAINRSFTATNSGRYFVATIDPVGCRSLFSDTVGVLFTAQSNEEKSSGFVYPSPTRGYFSLKSPQHFQGEVSIALFNSAGQRVKAFSANALGLASQQFDVSMLEPGIYWVETFNQDERTVSKLLIE